MGHGYANLGAWLLVLLFVGFAGWIDGKTRRLPNWLTVTGFAVGVGLHLWLGGWRGGLFASEGVVLGLLVLLPLVLLRALGAGDWKLMGALGAFVGPVMLWFVLLTSVLVAGVMAVVQMIMAGRVGETLRNVGLLVMGFFAYGFRAHPEISIDNPDALKLPFGVAVAIGTLICFFAANWHLALWHLAG